MLLHPEFAYNYCAMKRLFASFVVFALILGVWTAFAYIATTLASFLPWGENVRYVAGGVAMVSLLIAIGVAAHLVRKTLPHFSDPTQKVP